MKTKYGKVVWAILAAIFIACMGIVNAYAASEVYFCTEADCDFTVVFGGHTHTDLLKCCQPICFGNVSAGTYSFSGTGCGLEFSGSISVDGIHNYLICLCPGTTGLSCCSCGCGEEGEFLCDECAGGVPPSEPSDVCPPGTKPVYRFFNTQTRAHFYTISKEERDWVRNNLPQYEYEGIAWCCYPGDAIDTSPSLQWSQPFLYHK